MIAFIFFTLTLQKAPHTRLSRVRLQSPAPYPHVFPPSCWNTINYCLKKSLCQPTPTHAGTTSVTGAVASPAAITNPHKAAIYCNFSHNRADAHFQSCHVPQRAEGLAAFISWRDTAHSREAPLTSGSTTPPWPWVTIRGGDVKSPVGYRRGQRPHVPQQQRKNSNQCMSVWE